MIKCINPLTTVRFSQAHIFSNYQILNTFISTNKKIQILILSSLEEETYCQQNVFALGHLDHWNFSRGFHPLQPSFGPLVPYDRQRVCVEWLKCCNILPTARFTFEISSICKENMKNFNFFFKSHFINP